MAGPLTITWLGHATFLLRAADGTAVLVDPFVMNNPSCPPEQHRFARLDVVAVTHGHVDHVADVARIYEENRPSAVVAMVELAHWIRRQGVPDDVVHEMNKGGTLRVGSVAITMTDANHSTGIREGDEMVYCGQAAGLVLRFDEGPCVYHAGDTNVFGDMALIGELYRPDVALLPIGDHYTMGPREAAKACELLGVKRVIPMHFGTWPILAGTPAGLRDECDGRGLDVEIIELTPGESWG